MIIQIMMREQNKSLSELKDDRNKRYYFIVEKVTRGVIEYGIVFLYMLIGAYWTYSNLYRRVIHKWFHDDPDLVNNLKT